jgi:transcriptional regulator with XRE-family HTH domain
VSGVGTPNDAHALGQWLRHLREKAGDDTTGMSQAEAGAALNPPVEARSIRRWEREGDAPGGLTLLQLLDVYGVSLSEPPPRTARATSAEVRHLRESLERMALTIEALQSAVEMGGIGAAATAQAIDLLRRQRLGEPVPAEDLLRVAEALAGAIREHLALEEDLREAARAARSAP